MPSTAHTPFWLKFLKPEVDFFKLLSEQAHITHDGLVEFQKWICANNYERCESVRELEHKADDKKLEIEKALAKTFVTPFDREDIYDLSSLLDLVINGAKAAVKEIEMIKLSEVDSHLPQMCEILVTGTEELVKAIDNLDQDLKASEQASHKARKTEVHFAKQYRSGMEARYAAGDFLALSKTKEVYDLLSVVAQRIERLGEKLLHISIKLS